MDTHTHALTDAKRFYYLSHAICYSYGADNNVTCLHKNVFLSMKIVVNKSVKLFKIQKVRLVDE